MIQNSLPLLAATLITAPVTGVVTGEIPIGAWASEIPAHYLPIKADFTYGSGGTNVTAYVQTSLDEGVTWADIASFQFTTASASRVSALSIFVALAAAIVVTDGALTANTILNGLLGDRLRVKYTTTGTYAGGTSLKISAVPR